MDSDIPEDGLLREIILKELYKYRHEQDMLIISESDNLFEECSPSFQNFDRIVKILGHLKEYNLVDFIESEGRRFSNFNPLVKYSYTREISNLRITAFGIDTVRNCMRNNGMVIVNGNIGCLQIGINNSVVNSHQHIE